MVVPRRISSPPEYQLSIPQSNILLPQLHLLAVRKIHFIPSVLYSFDMISAAGIPSKRSASLGCTRLMRPATQHLHRYPGEHNLIVIL
jgi:hypothetical protein